MTDQFAGHENDEIARHEITRQEIASRENDGPKMTAGRKIIAMSSRLKCTHLGLGLQVHSSRVSFLT